MLLRKHQLSGRPMPGDNDNIPEFIKSLRTQHSEQLMQQQLLLRDRPNCPLRGRIRMAGSTKLLCPNTQLMWKQCCGVSLGAAARQL